jgi:hypothetical protein
VDSGPGSSGSADGPISAALGPRRAASEVVSIPASALDARRRCVAHRHHREAISARSSSVDVRYVVSRRQPGFTPDFAGLALYDGAKLPADRPHVTAGDGITCTDPSTPFGCSNDASPSDLVRFSVTPTLTRNAGAVSHRSRGRVSLAFAPDACSVTFREIIWAIDVVRDGRRRGLALGLRRR